MSVQQLVGFMAEGFAQVLLIKTHNIRILVGFSERQILVDLVYGFHTLSLHRHGGFDGLPASADAAARTCHYLNKVVR
ncbi:hypothetical protein SDC9_196356 [bioreactor metagenome]|uniref:Uncharacterized protein n=1 Tax=bioreactor metagenome TaxID=1076179 RepID=A0A645IK88_9ZZZZ